MRNFSAFAPAEILAGESRLCHLLNLETKSSPHFRLVMDGSACLRKAMSTSRASTLVLGVFVGGIFFKML